MRSRRSTASVLASAALALSLLACGDDDGGDSAAAVTTTGPEAPDGAAVEPMADVDLVASAAGTARVVLGASFDVTLDIDECRLAPDAEPDGQEPVALVAVRATGSTASGSPVQVDVQRFLSAGAATTITDTVTVLEGTEAEPIRVLVAQRFEVGGQVTDGRDPDADDPLLRVTAGSISAAGIFAPPGVFADEPGAVEGAISLTCA